MGRYYSGDIEGKFWFGVQASDDAGFFGGDELEPNYISYYFGEEHLPDIKEGLDKCKKELGDWKKKIDDFFEKEDGYNDKIVAKWGYDPKEFDKKLEWCARYELGMKIYKYVKKHGECNFDAEL